MHILLKRAYEDPADADGFRVLVDRLWPRGKKKVDMHLDLWEKDIAPSTELRKWFNHDPALWGEFCQRYKVELKTPERKASLSRIVHKAQEHSTVTLLYAAKDSLHNEAVFLQPIIQRAAAALNCRRPEMVAIVWRPKKTIGSTAQAYVYLAIHITPLCCLT